jgi:cyanide dihydratase
MKKEFQKFKVAVVQASPVLFNREATIEKTCRLILEAAEQDPKLILQGGAFGSVTGQMPLMCLV